MMLTTSTGTSLCTNVFDDDVPDEAPADDADAFPIDDVNDCKKNDKLRSDV